MTRRRKGDLEGWERLTPSAVVAELSKYVVGQTEAKVAVAIALRNRLRRRRLPPEMAREIAPKNILLIGPTGVGKTEIARRLAQLVGAPFVKVEATRFTEVGYVGRDVESMVRDLVDVSVQMVKAAHMEKVQRRAERAAEERILSYLSQGRGRGTEEELGLKSHLREALRAGELDEEEMEIEVVESNAPRVGLLGIGGMDDLGLNLQEMLEGLLPKRKRRRRVTVAEARRILQAEEAEKLIDMEAVVSEALEKAQEEGIVFIDELDKVASVGTTVGPDVSREGVQRDLLPVVEGCTVSTKYGVVRTDHILFIGAGAFTKTRPSDLIPELQGRFPIRVELKPLAKEDLKQILVQPENALVKQYVALLSTEGVELEFTEGAIDEIAEIACRINERVENIGARRLHTVMEKLLEEISFSADSMRGKRVTIDEEYVRRKLEGMAKDDDLTRFLL